MQITWSEVQTLAAVNIFQKEEITADSYATSTIESNMEKAIEQTVSHPPASSTVASMSTTVSGNVLDLEGRAVIKVEDSSPTTVVESPHKAQRSVQIFYWMVYESAFETDPTLLFTGIPSISIICWQLKGCWLHFLFTKFVSLHLEMLYCHSIYLEMVIHLVILPIPEGFFFVHH